jgi:hypothetical protein
MVLLFGGLSDLNISGSFERVRSWYPRAHIFGCTTAGLIAGARVCDSVVTVTAIEFDYTRVETARVRIPTIEHSFDAGANLARTFETTGLRHIFILSEAAHVNVSDLLRGIDSTLPRHVTVTGGLAGNLNGVQDTHVWCDGSPEQSSAVALALYGDRLRVGLASRGGWNAFGPERLVTKSKDNVVFELDGRSALGLYKLYLGEHAERLPASGLLFPLGLRVGEGQDRVLRSLWSVNEDEQSISVAGPVPERSNVRLMIANTDQLIDGASLAARCSVEDLGESAPQLSVLVSCVARREVLNQRIEEEVEAVTDVFGDQTVVTGFYSYGEIAPVAQGGRPELHNETMTVTNFAEV